MADGRMLKKQISRSRRLAELKTDSARLLYTWIIPHLDVKGRIEADPNIIKGEVVPRLTTYTLPKIQEYLEDMAAVGLITLYRSDGDQYLEMRKFEDHQSLRLNREAPSRIPSPEESGTTPGVIPEQSGSTPAEVKIREEKVRKKKLTAWSDETNILTQEYIDAAIELGLQNGQIEDQFKRFRDTALSKSWQYADWLATWRNFIRNQIEWGKVKPAQGTSVISKGWQS